MKTAPPLTTLFLPATGLYCKWLGGDARSIYRPAAFYFLVFLVCTVPFSWSLVSEKQSGYESHMVLSAGKPAYYISKYFASFLSGAYAVPEYASKRSKSTEMPERGYRGVSRKSKAHHSQSCCRSLTAHLPVHFKVRRNSPRIAAHAAPYLRDPND